MKRSYSPSYVASGSSSSFSSVRQYSLLVRKLNPHTSPQKLTEIFSKYGDIKDVYVPLNYYTKKPRGFGFVEYFNEKDTKLAMQKMQNCEIDGNKIEITLAKRGRSSPDSMRNRGRDDEKDRRDDRSWRDDKRDLKREIGRSERYKRKSRSRERYDSRVYHHEKRYRSHYDSPKGYYERDRSRRREYYKYSDEEFGGKVRGNGRRGSVSPYEKNRREHSRDDLKNRKKKIEIVEKSRNGDFPSEEKKRKYSQASLSSNENKKKRQNDRDSYGNEYKKLVEEENTHSSNSNEDDENNKNLNSDNSEEERREVNNNKTTEVECEDKQK